MVNSSGPEKGLIGSLADVLLRLLFSIGCGEGIGWAVDC